MKQKNKKEEIMLVNFSEKLDKNTCLVCLGIISLVIFVVVQADLFSAFDISGVFKQ